jgi:hypothetical protein
MCKDYVRRVILRQALGNTALLYNAGSNVHMLLENVQGVAPASIPASIADETDQTAASYFIPLSMRSKVGLEALVNAIMCNPGAPLAAELTAGA